jgi:hypothetical protein
VLLLAPPAGLLKALMTAVWVLHHTPLDRAYRLGVHTSLVVAVPIPAVDSIVLPFVAGYKGSVMEFVPVPAFVRRNYHKTYHWNQEGLRNWDREY